MRGEASFFQIVKRIRAEPAERPCPAAAITLLLQYARPLLAGQRVEQRMTIAGAHTCGCSQISCRRARICKAVPDRMSEWPAALSSAPSPPAPASSGLFRFFKAAWAARNRCRTHSTHFPLAT